MKVIDIAPTRQLLMVFVPSIFVLIVVAWAHIFLDVEIPLITRDVTTIAGVHPFYGALSNLGILLWCATASICFFTAALLFQKSQKKRFLFIFYSGLLSAYLLFDDLFLFHEALANILFGLNENVILVTLGVSVAAYLLAFRRIILQTKFGILLLAIGFLATSVFIDVVLVGEWWLSQFGSWRSFFEDGAKWLGIAFWCSYYVSTSYQLLTEAFVLPNHAAHSSERISHKQGEIPSTDICKTSKV